MKRWLFLIYLVLVFGFSAKSLILNTWSLLQLQLPQYHINRLFLSGTLLLYDRPMFFESRHIEIKEKGQQEFKSLEFSLDTDGYNSYLQRRLFRFSTNETNCGTDRKTAFNEIFCKPTLKGLKDYDVHEVTVRFVPHIKSGKERTFHHVCQKDE